MFLWLHVGRLNIGSSTLLLWSLNVHLTWKWTGEFIPVNTQKKKIYIYIYITHTHMQISDECQRCDNFSDDCLKPFLNHTFHLYLYWPSKRLTFPPFSAGLVQETGCDWRGDLPAGHPGHCRSRRVQRHEGSVHEDRGGFPLCLRHQ